MTPNEAIETLKTMQKQLGSCSNEFGDIAAVIIGLQDDVRLAVSWAEDARDAIKRCRCKLCGSLFTQAHPINHICQKCEEDAEDMEFRDLSPEAAAVVAELTPKSGSD